MFLGQLLPLVASFTYVGGRICQFVSWAQPLSIAFALSSAHVLAYGCLRRMLYSCLALLGCLCLPCRVLDGGLATSPLWLAFQGRALLMGEPMSSRDDGVTCLVWLPWPVCSLPHVGSFSRLRLRPWSGQGVAPEAPRAPAARPAGRRVLALPCLSPAWIGVEGTSFSRVHA